MSFWYSVEADGVELTLQRNPDGTIPLLKRLLSGPKTPPPAKTQNKITKIDLAPPVTLDALRLSHVKTHVIDLAVSPSLDAEVEMNLRFSDLASPIRPAKLNVELLPSPLMDSMVVNFEGRTTSSTLDATFEMKALGLHPKLLAGYLSPFGVRPMARVDYHSRETEKLPPMWSRRLPIRWREQWFSRTCVCWPTGRTPPPSIK